MSCITRVFFIVMTMRTSDLEKEVGCECWTEKDLEGSGCDLLQLATSFAYEN
jgi:hypothetical protein